MDPPAAAGGTPGGALPAPDRPRSNGSGDPGQAAPLKESHKPQDRPVKPVKKIKVSTCLMKIICCDDKPPVYLTDYIYKHYILFS